MLVCDESSSSLLKYPHKSEVRLGWDGTVEEPSRSDTQQVTVERKSLNVSEEGPPVGVGTGSQPGRVDGGSEHFRDDAEEKENR